MRKYIYVSLLILPLLFTTISCKNDKVMSMKNYVYSNRFYLNPSDTVLGSMNIEIDVEIPEKYHDNEILENIQKQIIAKIFGEQYTKVKTDSIIPLFSDRLHHNFLLDYDADFQQQIKKNGGPSMMDEIDIHGVSVYLDEKTLSYSNESYAFMGGAHGNSSRILLNFDLSNAKLINEHDLFIENYEPTLTQLIKDQLLVQSAELGSVSDLKDLDFWEDEIKPNNNFFVSEEGLVYVYNQYEIAPYSMGQIEVTLPYVLLKPLFKQGNVFEYLYLHPSKNEK